MTGQEVPDYSVVAAFLATARTWAEGETADEQKLKKLLGVVGLGDCPAATHSLLRAAEEVQRIYASVPAELKFSGQSAVAEDAISRDRARYIVRRFGITFAQLLVDLSHEFSIDGLEASLRAKMIDQMGLGVRTDDRSYVRQLNTFFWEGVEEGQ
jgi:hypothetical protein